MNLGGLARSKDSVTEGWAALQRRYYWVRHASAAWTHLQRNNGNQYAAAITYFSFLAIFPMLLLAVAVVGFVLYSHPTVEQSLFAQITDQVPGQLGDTLKTSVRAAIKARTGVGVVGLVGVLLSGLGWIGNLRSALDVVWARPERKRNFIVSRLANLLVLGGLGLGVLISVGLTVAGTSLTQQILRLVSLDDVPGSTVVLKVLGIAVAVLGDMVIFWWLLIKVPDADVPGRVAIRGALLAAVGFEVLKIVGSYTIAHTAQSATYGPFAGIIAILIWIQLVVRFMLYACAWMATQAVAARAAANTVPVVEPDAMTAARDSCEFPAVRPATVGATLIGAGAVAGAVATWAVLRRDLDPPGTS